MCDAGVGIESEFRLGGCWSPASLSSSTVTSSPRTDPAMASPLDLYEPLDIVGNGSFGIIRKVRRKADGLVSPILIAMHHLGL